jgi:hypothetical protein
MLLSAMERILRWLSVARSKIILRFHSYQATSQELIYLVSGLSRII